MSQFGRSDKQCSRYHHIQDPVNYCLISSLTYRETFESSVGKLSNPTDRATAHLHAFGRWPHHATYDASAHFRTLLLSAIQCTCRSRSFLTAWQMPRWSAPPRETMSLSVMYYCSGPPGGLGLPRRELAEQGEVVRRPGVGSSAFVSAAFDVFRVVWVFFGLLGRPATWYRHWH